MIYLLIDDGKENAEIIPMSAVQTIDKTEGKVYITTKQNTTVLSKTSTASVICTDFNSEHLIAQKIYDNFCPKNTDI